MAYRRRRIVLSAVFVLLVVLLGESGRLAVVTPARAQNGDANASWDALSPVNPSNAADTVNPPRLYANDLSHPLPASASLTLGTNGYCVTLHTQNLVADTSTIPAANLGFSLLGTNPISSSSPATVAVPLPGTLRADPTTPWLTSVDAPLGYPGTPTANGDKFCVVAQAPVGYKTLQVSWTYKDASGAHTITLNELADSTDPNDFIPVVTVTLRATAIGSFANVCTVGWDPSFLTGHASNPNTVVPDPLDQVAVGDWVPSSGGVTVQSVQLDPTDSTQWCATLSSGGATIDTNVTFSFDAVYNRLLPKFLPDGDDQSHTVTLSAPLHIPGGFALAHIGAGGDVLTQEVSPQLVVGAPEVACILGTALTDTMLPSDVMISPVSGQDQPTASVVNVFRGGPGTLAAGVPAGTLCFSYSSSTPGEQTVTANFSGGHAQWVSVTQPGTITVQTGPLVVQWNRIDSTALTSGGEPADGTITYTVIDAPLRFGVPINPATSGGPFTADMSLTEWVLGSHRSGGRTVSGYLQGAVLHATIEDPTGVCGHFTLPSNVIAQDTRSGEFRNGFASSLGVPNPPGAIYEVNNPSPPPQTIFTFKPNLRDIWGVSIGGRFSFGGDVTSAVDDLSVSIAGDSCSPGMGLRVKIDVFYPGQSTIAEPTEYVDFVFSYARVAKTPRVAWAGQVVPITYGFSGCPSSGPAIHVTLTRAARQRGSFIASSGVTATSSSASGDLDSSCSITVLYTSADPGEVDIQAMIDGNPYSKLDFPIFFLAIEDVTLTATTTSNVSSPGDLTATARGWFVGSNPSGRAAETKPDGRRLPADRWVVPDDWASLQGLSDFRSNWPGPDLPPLHITFLMQDEAVVNSFAAGVKNGAVGWLLPSDSSQATPQFTIVPDGQGVIPKPRTITLTAQGAAATIHTFGDYNLSFEGCATNVVTGSPHCKPGDVVGHTRYSAVADYIENPGKMPEVGSNVAQTEWTWGGLKQVTVVNTDVPYQKYVVAHLVDRDGYCDARSWNNVLGVRVQFQIDSGEGAILEAQGQPTEISSDRRMAIATTFDTVDDQGNKLNTGIAKATVADDECQAWVKVSDSLLNPVNVIVTFPAQPAPIPGNVRITGLICASGGAGQELFTVTNKGTNTVSLDGFALRSRPRDLSQPEQHLGLTGLLPPGQSATFAGGPGASYYGWSGGDVIMDDANDYLRLVWNNFELNRAFCDGSFSSPPIPDPLPADQEGQIVLDQVIPFGLDKTVQLVAGWNLVPGGVEATDIATAFAGFEPDLLGVYLWDSQASVWKRYLPGVPVDPATAITTIEKGQAYWIAVKRPFTVTLLK